MDSKDATPDKAREAVEAAHRAIGIDPATGLATDGKWPMNHRLRAEAMAAAGVSTDPAGYVSDALIAETKDRVEAERKADEEAQAAAEKAAAEAEAAKPSIDDKRADLVKAAGDLGVEVKPGDTKATIVEHIEAAASAAGQEG